MGPDPHTTEATSMWSTPAEHQHVHDADCSPTKTCRNMVGITFDGFGDPGQDLATAWKTTLEREGKLSSGSLRDLVMGDSGD